MFVRLWDDLDKNGNFQRGSVNLPWIVLYVIHVCILVYISNVSFIRLYSHAWRKRFLRVHSMLPNLCCNVLRPCIRLCVCWMISKRSFSLWSFGWKHFSSFLLNSVNAIQISLSLGYRLALEAFFCRLGSLASATAVSSWRSPGPRWWMSLRCSAALSAWHERTNASYFSQSWLRKRLLHVCILFLQPQKRSARVVDNNNSNQLSGQILLPLWTHWMLISCTPQIVWEIM